jgi:Uma2 family endonuclease
MTTTRTLTYEDLIALPDDGGLHELVRGEIRHMPPPRARHGDVEAAVVAAIDRYLYTRALELGWRADDGRAARHRLVGQLASGDAGIRFSLPDDPDQVRGVDVYYLTPNQYVRHEAVLAEGYVPEVPALCVEIISPSQSADDVDEKVHDYLAGGAEMVWCLFPRRRTGTVYTADHAVQTIGVGGVLDGGSVLPSLTIPLRELVD